MLLVLVGVVIVCGMKSSHGPKAQPAVSISQETIVREHIKSDPKELSFKGGWYSQ